MQEGFTSVRTEIQDLRDTDIEELKTDVKDLQLRMKAVEYGQENILLRLDQKLNKIDYKK
jgi:hypothetical protein